MTKPYAVVFPGQGSQSVGMLGELARSHPVVRDTYAEASEALGMDLWALVCNGPEAELCRTVHTQPAMLTAGYAVWRVWQSEFTAAPLWLAGHSLGEYTALTAAGALGFGDAVRLARERGRAMQAAVPEQEGAMAVVLGLTDEQVLLLCSEQAKGQILEAVNFNAPGQVAIAGAAQAVERAIAGAKAMGAKRALRLPVSVPSHCGLMRPAAERLAQLLQQVQVSEPRIPVLHNVDVKTWQGDENIREVLVRQLYSPVRWVETVRRLAAEGVQHIVECGPGKVLTGLDKRIAAELGHWPVYDAATLRAAQEALS